MKYELKIANDTNGTEVLLDGHKVPGLMRVTLEHEAGRLPSLHLELRVDEITTAGDVEPVFIIGNEQFSIEDIRRIRQQTDPCDLGDRLARALGLEST